MKIVCEKCRRLGYLQQLGNYYRVRHYIGIDASTKKPKFSYCQQSREYAQAKLKELSEKPNSIEQNNKGGITLESNSTIEHLNSGLYSNLKE